jgi:enamine deaminase RidA (YjgF/YER057c/UK114 family)
MNKTMLMLAAVFLATICGVAQAADYLEKSDFQKSRAFSPAVVTDGGRIVWMAGQTATMDADGKDISGNFEAQARRVFALMDQTRPCSAPEESSPISSP